MSSSFSDASTYAGPSYQSGASSFSDAYSYDPASLEGGGGNGPSGIGSDPHHSQSNIGEIARSGPSDQTRSGNVWESRIGFIRVDVMAALAYVGGPIAGAWCLS